MKNLLLIVLAIFFLFANCKRDKTIDTSMLDYYIITTDSLNTELTTIFNQALNGIYKISDDSLMADSISKKVILPNTVLFYQYLQKNISDINEIYYYAQKEIYFTQDQLEGLKEDVASSQISAIQYELQLDSEKEMIELLKERTESTINVIRDVSDALFITISDTIP